MKKLMVSALLAAGIFGTAASFAQADVPGKKAEKKEVKADKKESKGNMKKTMKKDQKMDKKESKGK